VTTGTPWPDSPDERQPAGDVLLLTAEDDLSDTVRPRLDVARADVERVVALEAVKETDETGRTRRRAVSLQADVERIEEVLDTLHSPRAVIVDPISAYLGAVDSHHNAEVRAVLSPLADLAQRRRLAVLAISHLRKSGGKAVYRTMGSLAFTAAARAVFGVVLDPDDEAQSRHLLLPIKTNLARSATGMAYTIIPKVLDGIGEVPAVAWETAPLAAPDVERLLGGDEEQGQDTRAYARGAAETLRKADGDSGPAPADDLLAAAQEAGINEKTLRRAKQQLGIRSAREGDAWMWSMP
jgi:hypothetical protein